MKIQTIPKNYHSGSYGKYGGSIFLKYSVECRNGFWRAYVVDESCMPARSRSWVLLQQLADGKIQRAGWNF